VTAGLFTLSLMAMMLSVHPVAALMMMGLAAIAAAVHMAACGRRRREALHRVSSELASVSRRGFRGMEDTWTNRDLPVLKAVVQIYDETGAYITRAIDIQQKTGFDQSTVQRALRALQTAPFFQEVGGGRSGNDIFSVGPPLGNAYQVAGAWPTPETQLGRLIAALEAVAANETSDEPERSKAKQAALWLGDTLSKIAIGALGGAGGLKKTISTLAIAVKQMTVERGDRVALTSRARSIHSSTTSTPSANWPTAAIS